MLKFNIIEIWTFSKMNIFVAIWAFWCFFRFFDFFQKIYFFIFFLNTLTTRTIRRGWNRLTDWILPTKEMYVRNQEHQNLSTNRTNAMSDKSNVSRNRDRWMTTNWGRSQGTQTGVVSPHFRCPPTYGRGGRGRKPCDGQIFVKRATARAITIASDSHNESHNESQGFIWLGSGWEFPPPKNTNFLCVWGAFSTKLVFPIDLFMWHSAVRPSSSFPP